MYGMWKDYKMNELMTVSFRKEICNLRKRNMIISGKCSALLPANIVGSTEYYRIIYNTSGYRKLSYYREIGAFDILDIAGKILACIDYLKDYLIFPEEYLLTPDFIFISEEFRKLRIAYAPTQKESSETAAISYCIFSLRKIADRSGKMYLETLGNILESGNFKLSGVLSSIDEMKREIKLYGID